MRGYCCYQIAQRLIRLMMSTCNFISQPNYTVGAEHLRLRLWSEHLLMLINNFIFQIVMSCQQLNLSPVVLALNVKLPLSSIDRFQIRNIKNWLSYYSIKNQIIKTTVIANNRHAQIRNIISFIISSTFLIFFLFFIFIF